MLELRASAGTYAGIDGNQSRVPVGSSTIGAIAAMRRPHVTSAGHIDAPLADPDSAPRDGIVTFAGYPLLVDSKLVGVMAIVSRRDLSPAALESVAAVADAVAVGIERKRAEAELARHTRHLEEAHDAQRKNAQQLAALVEELRLAQKSAEDATRAKSDFLASMSHELRTPLNAIILYSELLQEVAEDEGHESSITDLQRIQSSGKHLLELINGILDLSKIEAGKMTVSLETFEVRAMIDVLLDTVEPLVQKNANTLTVTCGVGVGTMTADLMKTRQILLNLLSNAAKFTRAGTIALDVQPSVVGGRPAIAFTVTDTGVGMTSEQASKVFDPFTQADVTTTRKYGGTGLGLALVSRFCRLMGGEVAVESQPTHRIAILGPLANRRRVPDVGGTGALARERRLGGDGVTMATIMVVEDNEFSRDALSRRLARRGYRIVLAVDGAQAIDLARAEQPDLILMDLGLPRVDGWEATRQLKADPDTRRIPIIVLSAHAMTNDRDKALQAGGDEFDTKPVRFNPLLDKIEALLARAATATT